MKVIVLDASAAAEWFMPTPVYRRAAAQMEAAYGRREVAISVPGFYLVEAAELAWKTHFRYGLSRAKADALVDALSRVVSEATPDGALLPRALQLAFEVTQAAQSKQPPAPQLRVYDALYVALAEQLGVDLWTADRRLHDAVRAGAPPALAGRVKLLGTDPFKVA